MFHPGGDHSANNRSNSKHMKLFQNTYGKTAHQRQLIFPSRITEIKVSYTRKVKDEDRIKITCSDDAVDVLRARWKKNRIQYVEEFKVLLLDRGNRVLGVHNVSQGGQAGCVVDPKIIFGAALKAHSASLIMFHNHPSGQLTPSEADCKLTRKLKEAGQMLDLPVLDHIILTQSAYYSFADNGVL